MSALGESWLIWRHAPAMQLSVTKCIGTAAPGKASMVLRRSWQAELQLEFSKHNVIAVRKVIFHHSATLALCGIAEGQLREWKT